MNNTEPAPRSPIPFRAAALVWAGAWLVGGVFAAPLVAALFGTDASTSIPAVAVGAAAMWTVFIAGLVFASRRWGTGRFVADYALRFRPVDLVAVPLGAVAQLVIPVVYWPLQQIWPGTFNDEALQETARDLVDRAGGWRMVVLVAVVVVGAPIVEELVYRGLLQRSLAGATSPVIAWVAASGWFALIHLRPVELVGLWLAGLTFGGCVLVTRRVGPAIVAHVAFNATGLYLATRL